MAVSLTAEVVVVNKLNRDFEFMCQGDGRGSDVFFCPTVPRDTIFIGRVFNQLLFSSNMKNVSIRIYCGDDKIIRT